MTDQLTVDQATDTNPFYYPDNHAHLVDELRRLDLRIEARVVRFRAESNHAARAVVQEPLCIPHAQVDWLLVADHVGWSGHATGDEEGETGRTLAVIQTELALLDQRISVGIDESLERGIYLALPHLAQLFRLSPFEMAVVVICLAPELRRKYDTLYAYLQDDITRKKPSVDLMLDLLCPTETDRWRAHAYLGSQAPLQQARIVQMVEDPQSPSGSSGLAQFLRLDPRIVSFLLGHHTVDERLRDLVQLQYGTTPLDGVPVEATTKTALVNLVQQSFAADGPQRLVCQLYGPRGVGRRALAMGICRQIGCPLLVVDLRALPAQGNNAVELLRLAFREGLLTQAALYLEQSDLLAVDSEHGQDLLIHQLRTHLARLHGQSGWLTFLAGEKQWPWQQEFSGQPFHSLQLTLPAVPLRAEIWQQTFDALDDAMIPAQEVDGWAQQLAEQFQMTPVQIHDAVHHAVNQRLMAGAESPITLADLYTGCRQQANIKLADLAQKVDYRYGWSDLVLPEGKLTQLQEICRQVRHRYRVLGEWGFGEKLGHGRGLSVLFSGPPGTGKTLAATVIAGELQLDLYKIDLSGVVSKYIGETEKNLSKIFQEAERSNAILFFDEADALFGKRTEVSDARDRYANIETSYLLQKMEEYEGIVILATNLRENMDEAFTRRIRFIIDFPFPDVASRRAIWRTHFPAAAPIDKEVDVELLARQLPLAGGNIKNIVLNAAYYAAENGQVIDMAHILHGAQREFEKIGKIWEQKKVV
jgi:hypothetical protein